MVVAVVVVVVVLAMGQVEGKVEPQLNYLLSVGQVEEGLRRQVEGWNMDLERRMELLHHLPQPHTTLQVSMCVPQFTACRFGRPTVLHTASETLGWFTLSGNGTCRVYRLDYRQEKLCGCVGSNSSTSSPVLLYLSLPQPAISWNLIPEERHPDIHSTRYSLHPIFTSPDIHFTRLPTPELQDLNGLSVPEVKGPRKPSKPPKPGFIGPSKPEIQATQPKPVSSDLSAPNCSLGFTINEQTSRKDKHQSRRQNQPDKHTHTRHRHPHRPLTHSHKWRNKHTHPDTPHTHTHTPHTPTQTPHKHPHTPPHKHPHTHPHKHPHTAHKPPPPPHTPPHTHPHTQRTRTHKPHRYTHMLRIMLREIGYLEVLVCSSNVTYCPGGRVIPLHTSTTTQYLTLPSGCRVLLEVPHHTCGCRSTSATPTTTTTLPTTLGSLVITVSDCGRTLQASLYNLSNVLLNLSKENAGRCGCGTISAPPQLPTTSPQLPHQPQLPGPPPQLPGPPPQPSTPPHIPPTPPQQLPNPPQPSTPPQFATVDDVLGVFHAASRSSHTKWDFRVMLALLWLAKWFAV